MHAVGFAHVKAECGLPVRDGRYEDLVARLLCGAVVSDERADRSRTLVPTGEGRHFPDRLVGEHVGDGVDVVPLERRDIPCKQFTFGVVGDLFRRIVLWRSILELLSGALEKAVHGCGRDADGVGHLGGSPLQHVAQDQDGSLPLGQVL